MSAAPVPLPPGSRHLTRLALVSVVAALTTLGLKFGAYAVTGSAGLLSDAVESTANLVAALTAVFALWYAARPVDREHTYGHEKIEFFASGIEGGLILVAAGGIAYYAIERLFNPHQLESVGIGLVASLVASLLNLGVGLLLLKEGRDHASIVLEADGRHLIADVWTSLGVVAGLLVVGLTGIDWIDPALALVVALNIVRTGLSLVRTSFAGLMDQALPETERARIHAAIEAELGPEMRYHALRSRHIGARHLIDFHLLVPGRMSIAEGHRHSTRIERAIDAALPGTESTIHLEPIEEQAAWTDSPLVALEEE